MRVASGKEIGEQNVLRFQTWIAAKTMSEFTQIVRRGVLSRTEIAKECGFSKSVLIQNPTVKAALTELEESLRREGVLPVPVPPNEMIAARSTDKKALANAERLQALQLTIAALRTENHDLKEQLKRYTRIAEALASTGRIPR
jgi:predicted RNase H-like nuclease (RuvC/YqgF family)